MADEKAIDELKTGLQNLLQYDDQDLIAKPEWGTVTFLNAKNDIETILATARDLDALPLEHLTNNQARAISRQIESCSNILQTVAEFSVDEGGYVPSHRRDEIANEVGSAAETLLETTAPQIPYLAYKRGDVADNISNLRRVLRESEDALENSIAETTSKKTEIDRIVAAAREAAASAGVATFTQEFDDESRKLGAQSRAWLIATGLLAVATLSQIVIPMEWFALIQTESASLTMIQAVFTKAASITILLTCTIWSGRIYRALVHQSSVNRHRALSLRTFQAFAEAADDPHIKDAVLLEATRAIFGSSTTGLVEHDPGNAAQPNMLALNNLPGPNNQKGHPATET